MKNSSSQLLAYILNMVVTVVCSIFAGYFIDNWLKTAPIFILIFLLLSVVWMFMMIYKYSKN